MVAYQPDQTAFREWVLSGFKSAQGGQEKNKSLAKLSSEVEEKIQAIAMLRRNRTAFDRPIDAIAA